MKRLIGITAVISGLLLVAVPRYILPACEYARPGLPHMHCSDTAAGEMIIGGLFILLGILTLLFKSIKMTAAGCFLSIALAVVAMILPDKIGYCLSSSMPCNYGMVPAVRFVAGVSGSIMIAGLGGLLMRRRRKGTA